MDLANRISAEILMANGVGAIPTWRYRHMRNASLCTAEPWCKCLLGSTSQCPEVVADAE